MVDAVQTKFLPMKHCKDSYKATSPTKSPINTAVLFYKKKYAICKLSVCISGSPGLVLKLSVSLAKWRNDTEFNIIIKNLTL